MEIKITKIKCLRCGYEWFPRSNRVMVCCHCKSAYWNIPREPKKVVKKIKSKK